jgi:ABC-type nitrate/sulfonate/bicarbonate transport system substrate-binding protein
MKVLWRVWLTAGVLLLRNGGICAPAELETLTVGAAPSATTTLEWVADEMGFFQAEDLQARFIEYPSGKEALDDVLLGKVDVAAASAIPLAVLGFNRADFRILGSVANLANDNVLVARRDAGILKVTDLKGKRVGTSPGIMPHYMLDLLLRKHGFNSNDVAVTLAPQSQLVESLAQGGLDGATLLGKYINQAQLRLGTNALRITDPALFDITIYLAVRDTLVRQRPRAIEKFLRACLRAEDYVATHPEQSMAIVARRLKMNLADIRQSWPYWHFNVYFHQAALNDLENMARWQAELHPAPDRRLPNFLNVLHYQALERIAPERVTVIH